ncbi:MAG: hypothetical protein RLN86_02655 [Cyclobacteriaceae bacterium]
MPSITKNQIQIRTNLLTSFMLVVATSAIAQEFPSPERLLNKVVGGVWVSTNEKNANGPEDFKTFFMSFDSWGDRESATGNIFGITNAGDTTQLMEVWNFVDKANKNVFLVQRDAWGGKSIGAITPHEGQHLDIQFKTTLADGRSYYTRDIHYFEDENKIKAVTYHKSKEVDEWKESGTSLWIRRN